MVVVALRGDCCDRHHVWTAYDVIKQAGYPVERHRGIRTDDDYRMEMVRIYNKGEILPTISFVVLFNFNFIPTLYQDHDWFKGLS